MKKASLTREEFLLWSRNLNKIELERRRRESLQEREQLERLGKYFTHIYIYKTIYTREDMLCHLR